MLRTCQRRWAPWAWPLPRWALTSEVHMRVPRSALPAAVLLVALLGIPVAVAGAATPNVVGSGTTTCYLGSPPLERISFVPPLKNGGTAAKEEVSIDVTLSSCFGGTPTPRKGTLLAKGAFVAPGADNCANFFSATTPYTNTLAFTSLLSDTITWTSSGPPLTATKVTFGTLTMHSTGAQVTFSSTAGSATGSYPTTAASQALRTLKTNAYILGRCHVEGGLSYLTIRGSGTKGTY